MMIPIDAYAALQTFPTNYFDGDCPVSQIRKMIGNAVPPQFAKKLMQCVKVNQSLGYRRVRDEINTFENCGGIEFPINFLVRVSPNE